MKLDRRCIGMDGLGNPRSRVAHSLAWFRGKLYVGVTHHRGEGSSDRARILRYDPTVEQWEQALVSPLVACDDRATAQDILRRPHPSRGRYQSMVPKYRGFRSMLVFQGRSDAAPALYVSPISHWGSELLRSEDGIRFEVVSQPGFVNPDLISFRSLLGFKGRMFAAPTGVMVDGNKIDRNFGDPTVYVCDDPRSGDWRSALDGPGFGDPDNESVTCMRVFNQRLYATTGNPARGFQLWRTDAEGEPPFRWHNVLRDGAGRYNLNETAPTMRQFRGALYIGTGLPGLGYDTANDVGPSAAELIRVFPDDRWELVVGTARFSPDGLKVPFAAMGPGFDDPFNSVIWSMETHGDRLFAGTHHWQTFDDAMRRKPELHGGFHLWATEDGDAWTPLTREGFGDPYEIGVRTLLSTEMGLVVGTSNHQEIESMWRRRGKEASSSEGAGGAEVWVVD